MLTNIHVLQYNNPNNCPFLKGSLSGTEKRLCLSDWVKRRLATVLAIVRHERNTCTVELQKKTRRFNWRPQ